MRLDLSVQLRAASLPQPETEYQFAKPRRWRFDYCWPAYKVALEVEGGAFIGGRHTRGKGFVNDLEKYNAATLMGWRVLRFTPQQIADGTALNAIQRALQS